MLSDEETLEHRASRCKSVSYRFILVLSAAATLLLVLTYFSILLNVFVFADEYRQLRLFGSKSVLEAIGDYAYYGFRSMGRPLSAGTYVAYRALAGDGYTGLVWVRALSLALSAIFISTVATIFGLAWQSRAVAWATAIMLIGAPGTQAAAFYSMTSPYMLGSAAAALGATLVMVPASTVAGFYKRCAAAFLLLQSSWFVYQFSPFVAGPVAAAFALSSLARQQKALVQRQVIVGFLLLATMLTFVFIYRTFGEPKAARPQYASNLIGLLVSWRFNDVLSSVGFEHAAETFYFSDTLGFLIKGEPTEGMRILSALALLGFTASLLSWLVKYRSMLSTRMGISILLSVSLLASPIIPLVMDNFSMRQHTLPPATLAWWVIIISSYYFVVESKILKIGATLRWTAIMLLLVWSVAHLVTAAAKVRLNVVVPYAALGEYIEEHLSILAGQRIQKLEVVLPNKRKLRNICGFPPCLGFYMRGPLLNRQFRKPDMLRQFARRAGVTEGPATVVIVGAEEADLDALRVDLFARARYGAGERKRNGPRNQS